jgi:hypothetical protein
MRADDETSLKPYDVRTFLRSVEDLTTMKNPRLVRRALYGTRNETQNAVIASVLCRLFTDTDTSRFASTMALNRALSFLCKHTELFHQINLLYDQCRHLRLSLQPSTYSYVLQAMLSRGNMVGFRQVLADQLAGGDTPDPNVWLALLRSRSSLEQKRNIAQWMQRKGLLEIAFVKGQVASEMLSAEVEQVMHEVKNPYDFIASIDGRFGRDWMSQISVVRVLQTCRRS